MSVNRYEISEYNHNLPMPEKQFRDIWFKHRMKRKVSPEEYKRLYQYFECIDVYENEDRAYISKTLRLFNNHDAEWTLKYMEQNPEPHRVKVEQAIEEKKKKEKQKKIRKIVVYSVLVIVSIILTCFYIEFLIVIAILALIF